MLEFYSATGDAICFSRDDEHLYLWKGRPVAYLLRDRVYTFNERQLGWFENGWLYDRRNRPALFTRRDAVGGPIKPVRKVKAVKAVPAVHPVKGAKQAALGKPARSEQWSAVSGRDYFDQ